MIVKNFELVNGDKVRRALEGNPNRDGEIVGGILAEDGTYDEGELLAAYDKLGGLIRKNGDKVKMGSFYDFKAKKMRAVPQIVLLYRVNGKVIEVPEGAEEPGIVKASKILKEQENEERVEKEARVEERVEARKKAKKAKK